MRASAHVCSLWAFSNSYFDDRARHDSAAPGSQQSVYSVTSLETKKLDNCEKDLFTAVFTTLQLHTHRVVIYWVKPPY